MNSQQPLLKESGLVTQIEGDLAWVNTANKLSCSSCKVESTCGNGILEKYLAGKVFISKIKNELDAKVGDQVEIAIPVSSVTRASLIVYCLPLLGLLIGAFIGDYWFSSESGAIVTSIFGLITGLTVTHFYNRKIADNEYYVPKMVSKQSTNYAAQAFESIKVKNLS